MELLHVIQQVDQLVIPVLSGGSTPSGSHSGGAAGIGRKLLGSWGDHGGFAAATSDAAAGKPTQSVHCSRTVCFLLLLQDLCDFVRNSRLSVL